jgi:predicted transcriptional regulator of viral defense system
MASDRSLRLLDKLASEGRTAFIASEVQEVLELSPQATSNVLGRLVEAGLVDRVSPPVSRLSRI